MNANKVDSKDKEGIPRTVAIFLDYVNLEQTIEDKTERFNKMRDLSWLLNPILEKKWRIVYPLIFIPDHYVNRIPLMTLTRKFGFQVIVCPRQVESVAIKDADTVDTKMKEFAWSLIEHSDITDVIIVSGDADFQSLAVFATNQGKKVTLVSTAQAVSGRFLDMGSDGMIEVKLLS